MKTRLYTVALASVLWVSSAQATLFYSNDFDSAAFVAAGIGASGPTNGSTSAVQNGPYNASNGKSWAGNYFLGNQSRNGTSVVTLTNLPVHTGASIDMLLGFLNSWDSRDGNCCTPDNLDVYIDGTRVLNMTTNNALGSIVDFDGGNLLVDNGQIDGVQSYSDDLVDMATASALTFSHTASTLTLAIGPSGSGWQGWTDEGWGMDDLRIELTGVQTGGGGGNDIPEPSTLAILGFGLAGLAGVRRRKAKA